MDSDKFEPAAEAADFIALQITTELSQGRGSQLEYLRWRNNLAVAHVLSGDYPTASTILQGAVRRLHGWADMRESAEALILQCNAAWVFYHLDDRARVATVREAVSAATRYFSADPPRIHGWVQLWSRQGFENTLIVPPFGVEGRLRAMRGDYDGAWDVFEADASHQGPVAAGSRYLLGEIGMILGKEQEARRFLGEIDGRHVPPSSWGHMKSGRDIMLWCVVRHDL